MLVDIEDLDLAEWTRYVRIAEMCALTTGALLREIGKGHRSNRKHEIRFWLDVDFNGECCLWQGTKDKNGYGHFNYMSGHVGVLVHRFAWTFTRGRPGALHVLHSCDVPACVRPNHLYLGTHLENMRDKVMKGRQSRVLGSASPNARLTEAAVSQIRELWHAGGWTMTALSQQFKVSIKTISLVVRNKAWTHV